MLRKFLALLIFCGGAAQAEELAYYYSRVNSEIKTRVGGVSYSEYLTPLACNGAIQYRLFDNPFGQDVFVTGISLYIVGGSPGGFFSLQNNRNYAFLAGPFMTSIADAANNLRQQNGGAVSSPSPVFLGAGDQILEEVECPSNPYGYTRVYGVTIYARTP